MALVAAAGVAARLLTLAQDALWADELYSWAVTRLTWEHMLLTRYDVHPPLYYSLLKLTTVFGDGEFALRSLSAACGVATAGLAFLFASRHCGAQAALIGASVVLFSQRLIVHSSTARNYALMLLLCFAASWAMVATLQRLADRRRFWAPAVAYGFLALAALMTHPVAAVYLLTLSGVALVAFGAQSKQDLLRVVGLLSAINAPAYLILALWFLGARDSASDFDWLQPFGPLDAMKIYLSNVAPVGVPAPLTLACGLCVMAGVLVAVLRGSPAFWTPVVAMTIALPACLYLASPLKPLYMERTILTASVGAGLAIAALTAGLANRRIGMVLGVCLSLAYAASALAYLGRGKSDVSYGMQSIQDFRSAMAFVDAELGDDAAVVTCEIFTAPAFEYYGSKPPYRHLVHLGPDGFARWDRSWESHFGRPATQRPPWRWNDPTAFDGVNRILFLDVAMFCGGQNPGPALARAGFVGGPVRTFQGVSVRIFDRSGPATTGTAWRAPS
jgi:mannosyltransferase